MAHTAALDREAARRTTSRRGPCAPACRPSVVDGDLVVRRRPCCRRPGRPGRRSRGAGPCRRSRAVPRHARSTGACVPTAWSRASAPTRRADRTPKSTSRTEGHPYRRYARPLSAASFCSSRVVSRHRKSAVWRSIGPPLPLGLAARVGARRPRRARRCAGRAPAGAAPCPRTPRGCRACIVATAGSVWSRGYGRSIGRSAKFFPPYATMMIRFESWTASSTSWVTNRTVFCVSLPDRLELLTQGAGGDRVQVAERLVHQQQVGLHRERARDPDALLHAAGQMRRIHLLEALAGRPCRCTARCGRASRRPCRWWT